MSDDCVLANVWQDDRKAAKEARMAKRAEQVRRVGMHLVLDKTLAAGMCIAGCFLCMFWPNLCLLLGFYRNRVARRRLRPQRRRRRWGRSLGTCR